MLTIPRSNQVVYKGFPSAILIVSIRLRRRPTFQSDDALPTQGMIQSDKSLFEKLFTQQTKHFVGFQPGFRLRGVQPLSHAWQLLSNALSSNRIYQSCEWTVPLVLSSITVTTNITHFSRIKLTCLATV